MVDKEAPNISVSVPGNLPMPAPEGANFFHFTVVGGEVQLLVGSINLLRLHEAKRNQETATIVPQITHRFLLSPLGFAQLKSSLEEIAKAMGKTDVGVSVNPASKS